MENCSHVSALPVVCFPRKDILWLELRYACCPQVFTLLTSAQICWRVICKTHTHKHGQPRPQCQLSGSARCECDAETHRLPVGVLPQVAVAVAGGGDADVVLVRAVTSQTAVTAGAVVVDRLSKQRTASCEEVLLLLCSMLETKTCKTNETFGITQTCRKSL